jgi:hypothetical protein
VRREEAMEMVDSSAVVGPRYNVNAVLKWEPVDEVLMP